MKHIFSFGKPPKSPLLGGLFVRISLVFTLLFSSIPTSTFAKLFSDVPLDHEYFEAISELEDRGILNGFSDGTFRPDDQVVRAAALKVILMGAGIEMNGIVTKKPFPDVPVDEWFALTAKKGQEIGVVKGDGEGNFLPSRNVSRAEAVAMLFRVNGNVPPKVTEAPFSDVSLDAWFAPYFQLAKKTSLLKNDPVDPHHLLSRAELSDLTYRFFRSDWNESQMIGKASYYGDGFEGRGTSSGETFSNAEYMAAHRTLPFGTRVRVTHSKTLESVVVRISDRGPYVTGRVIDLSQAAFEVLTPLSRGIAPVVLSVVPETTPLGPDENCPLPKPTNPIAKDFYKGIELFTPPPTQFRRGEVFVFSGKLVSETPSEYVTAFFKTSDGQQEVFRGKTKGSTFSIPVYFEETGDFFFSLLPGKDGTAKAETVRVRDLICEPIVNTETSAPKDLVFSVHDGKTLISWTDGVSKLFRIEFTQDGKTLQFYVRGDTSFSPPLAPFDVFSEGTANMKIWSAEVEDSSFVRTTSWAFGGEYSIYLTDHVSRYANQIQSEYTLTDTYSLGEKISIKGMTKESLDSNMVVIDPQENIMEIELDIMIDDFETTHFSANFTPKILGNYMIEVNRKDALALFVGGVVPEGTLPLLPDYFDLNPHFDVTSAQDISNMPNEMLKLVNIERKIRRLDDLTFDENLSELAQFRADDMCNRDYFAHEDPEGKKADDYRVLYGVKTIIGENISKNTSARSAHEGLMRSPGHRKLIIDPTFSRVGFGFCEEKKGTYITVQIFGGEPFLADEIPAWREKFLQKINTVRMAEPIVPSVTLDSIAQQWANKMADENFMGFEKGDKNLEKSLRNAGVTQSAQGAIFKLGNLTDLLEQFSESPIKLGEINQENFLLDLKFEKFGVGIAQNDVWEIYVVILAAE